MARPATAAVRLLAGEREPVRLATTGNITLVGLQTIDGVLTNVGDRILVKDQADARENGIYTASAGAWFRAADARHSRAITEGVTVAVQEGTAGDGKTYRFSSVNPKIGTDPISLTYFLSASLSDDISAAAIAAIQPLVDAAEEAQGGAESARDAAEAAAGSIGSPVSLVATGLQTMAGPLETNKYTYFDGDHIPVSKFGIIGDGSDEGAKWESVLAFGQALYDAGRRGVVIDLEGRTIGIPYKAGGGFVINGKWNNARIKNGGFKAVGVWPNLTSGPIHTFFSTRQTVTQDGKTWVLRDPICRLEGFCDSFAFENVIFDGAGQAAGLHIGTSDSKMRSAIACIFDNFVGYGVYMQTTFRLFDCRVRGPSDHTLRNMYGVVYDAIDTIWSNTTIQWCHCPLLTTGATLYISNCDLFNGSNGGPDITSRLWEHRGNTVTWIGGRLGNGQIHCWSTDLSIMPTKHGYTSGNGSPSVFVFWSDAEVSKPIRSFMYYCSEMAVALRNNTVKFIDLRSSNGGSWAPTAFQVEELYGYMTWYPDRHTWVCPEVGVVNPFRFMSMGTSCKITCVDDGNDTTNPVRFGSEGENFVIETGNVARWEVFNNGVLRPRTAGTGLGAAAARIGTIYLQTAPDVSSDARLKEEVEDIPAQDLAAAQVIKGLIKRYKMKGGDGRWRYGIIAQEAVTALEAQGIDPRSVGFLSFNDGDEDNGMMSVAYDELQMLLLAALSLV